MSAGKLFDELEGTFGKASERNTSRNKRGPLGIVWKASSKQHAAAMLNAVVSELKKKHEYSFITRR